MPVFKMPTKLIFIHRAEQANKKTALLAYAVFLWKVEAGFGIHLNILE